MFINNWVERVGKNDFDINPNNIFPANNGFFFEISKGAICVGNVFVNCDNGIMVLNASNVQMYNNTFVNSMVTIARTARSAQGDHFGWHPATGPDVHEREGNIFVNNLVAGDESFQRPLMFVWQPSALCERLTQSQLAQLDYNVYVRGAEKTKFPLMLWSPAANQNCQSEINSLEDIQKMYPQFAKNSKYFGNYDGPLFVSNELGIYRVLPEFAALKSGTQLPSEISKKIKMKGNYIGAFPSK